MFKYLRLTSRTAGVLMNGKKLFTYLLQCFSCSLELTASLQSTFAMSATFAHIKPSAQVAEKDASMQALLFNSSKSTRAYLRERRISFAISLDLSR